MLQREGHKKQRTLDVERASLEQQQSVCNATVSARKEIVRGRKGPDQRIPYYCKA
jgi:hypothetical protein